ncbi:MAG: TetR/AcrR family transcriptional regulator, partial [Acidimicrobiales bacterium]
MPRSQRARSSRALTNDAIILEAAIAEVLRVGVDHVSLRDVAHHAGLTHGATYARYEDVDELLVDLWNTRLCAHVIDIFELCMTAASEPNPQTVALLFRYIRSASDADVAAIHLLFTARRIPALFEEVEFFVDNYLKRSSYDEIPKGVTFSRGMILYAVVLVHIFADARLGQKDDYLDVLERTILNTLVCDARDVAPVALRSPAEYLNANSSDDLDAQLTFATLSVVSKSGYTRATISRIARRANCSPGAIYKLYPSKEDLVIATLRKLMKARWMRVGNFVDVLQEGSITQLLYAAASPENELRMSFSLETGLTAFQSDKLRD